MNMPEKTCETCKHYISEALGDYGSAPYEERCSRYDNDPSKFAKLTGITGDPEEDKRFPYSEAPCCYEAEFWHTEFAHDLDGSQERLDAAYERFKAFMDHGHPL